MGLLGRVVDATPQWAIAGGLDVVRRLPFRQGTPVYEREWDVLVVLDACRYDMYQRVVGDSDALLSVGSTSTEWMNGTFTDRYAEDVASTAYVSANPYSHKLDAELFGRLDHVWEAHWDDDLGTIPPEPVTDHGIAVARTGDYDRVICHYMQPHFPFIADGEGFGRLGRGGFGLGEDDSVNVWDMVERGEVDAEAVIEAYDANLAYVFESVETLLDNVDGTVAITADHGNALGEWGMWGHRAYVPSMALKKVPWDVRAATDSGTYDPEFDPAADTDRADEDVQDRLRALGYTEE
jgi:hypothetical protein